MDAGAEGLGPSFAARSSREPEGSEWNSWNLNASVTGGRLAYYITEVVPMILFEEYVCDICERHSNLHPPQMMQQPGLSQHRSFNQGFHTGDSTQLLSHTTGRHPRSRAAGA